MTRELAGLIMAAAAALILLAMFFAWRARLRRDSGLSAPIGVPEHAEVTARQEILYVATTKHDQPLERVAIRPLTYRARGELVLTDRGVALSLDGAPTVFLASGRLVAADRATVTIDRVVERDGLIRLVWRAADGILVDSFLRLASADPQQILPELERLCAASENGVNP
ncbi:PH-like domain-containing protein [Microbacterium alcoholitolerans]|uniref:PH-like domain-containing protein n=1 Tax=unclassified Microbacterium TaxID=2609290 RepID=UPI003D17BA4F